MGDAHVVVTTDTSYTGDVWQGQLTTQQPGARDPSDPYVWYEYLGALCALEWGAIHIFAAFLLCPSAFANNLSKYLTSLYDALDEDTAKAMEYQYENPPRFTCRVLAQHALNLGWIGGFAVLAPFFVADETFCRYTWWCMLPCFFADCCYWVCVDVPELCGPISQIQTYICSIALWCFALSVYERFEGMGEAAPDDFECFIMFLFPLILFFMGIIQKVLSVFGVPYGGMRCFICEDDEKPEAPPEKEEETEEEPLVKPKVLKEGGYGDLHFGQQSTGQYATPS